MKFKLLIATLAMMAPFNNQGSLVGTVNVTGASGTLPIAHGGTGSTTQNFVDLTTTQASIGGAKTFTSALTLSAGFIATANSVLGADASSNTTLTTSYTLRGPTLVSGGTADQAGGNLTLSTGSGKGSGTPPTIIFKTPPIGSTGTALTAAATSMTLGYNSTRAGPTLYVPSDILMDGTNGTNSGYSWLEMGGSNGAFIHFTSNNSFIRFPSADAAFVIQDEAHNPYLTFNGSALTLGIAEPVIMSATLAHSAATAISAAGTNQATCTQLTADFSNVTTVASGTGVCLPTTRAGAQFVVHTSGANSLLIYANPGGGTINGQSASSSITLVNTAGASPGSRIISCYSSTLCFSSATLPDTN